MYRPGPKKKIPCTYDDCKFLFASVEEMRKHKEMEPLHDYCAKCDIDFEDEERHLIHKLQAENKHIVCPICGIDFRSEGGRDAHIRQNHRAEQHLVCHGCKVIFKSAAGLMKHIEDNECSVISQTRLLQEQSKKFMIKEALRGGEGPRMPVIPNSADLDDIDGGVKLSFLDLGNREAISFQPKPGRDDPTASVDAMLALKHWPALGDSRGQATFGVPMSDLMAFSDAGDNEERLSAVGASPARGKGSFGAGTPEAGQTLRLLDDTWDATKFFNSFIGKYICVCGSSFPTMKEFEEHVLMKSKAKRNVQCPGCLKIFKSAAALVAHCESPSVHCSINEQDVYGQFMDEVSGGLIQAVGYNDDGTIKYEAGKLDTNNTRQVEW
ncbi:hypothetical protein SI65_04481 [Aspergillus cristatus]|uniref:C2H2-type domain-containing protein n=1 Tax=Aspergillus cristatus TaxID=573508 RepID=A0A1E3BEZ4_ASPCR|nr:hypothetical protein SI65_04481 [Aspergillus cristatus]